MMLRSLEGLSARCKLTVNDASSAMRCLHQITLLALIALITTALMSEIATHLGVTDLRFANHAWRMQRAASAAKPSSPNTILFGMLHVEMQLKAKPSVGIGSLALLSLSKLAAAQCTPPQPRERSYQSLSFLRHSAKAANFDVCLHRSGTLHHPKHSTVYHASVSKTHCDLGVCPPQEQMLLRQPEQRRQAIASQRRVDIRGQF